MPEFNKIGDYGILKRYLYVLEGGRASFFYLYLTLYIHCNFECEVVLGSLF